MTRWHVVKGRKTEKELLKRFTDIKFEIDCWESLRGKAVWADGKNVQQLIDRTLFEREFGEIR